jgi:hypothetical protein
MVNALHQTLANAKLDSEEINVNSQFVLEKIQLTQLFAQEKENVMLQTHVNVIKDSQESNVKLNQEIHQIRFV